MSNTTNDALLVPVFKTIAVPNEARSREAGRPIFDDMEVVEIRFGGDRNKISVFPAHAETGLTDGSDGYTTKLTYAQRFPEQYRAFKQQAAQIVSGTPVEELPFLTQAKRSELKALNIHTAETLAALDGTPLKTLGIGGRDLKDQAVAYLQSASGSAETDKLRRENEALRAQLQALYKAPTEGETQAEGEEPAATDEEIAEPKADEPAEDDGDHYDALTSDELKDKIEDLTGSRPRGNPSKKTLIATLKEAESA